jgi:hypothetical protein
MADPISAAIMAVVSYVGAAGTAVAAGTATLAQIATVAAVNIGTSLAVSATASLLQPKVGAGGSPTAFKADPNAPIRGVMGYIGVGGTQMHMRSWGKENVFLSIATVLSLGPIASIDGFTANGNAVSFPGSQGIATSGPFVDKMWQTSKLGLPTDAALGPPTGQPQGSPAMSEWTSLHKSSGHAGVFWTMRTNSKRASYETGVPMPQWTGHWMRLWDPRYDSTYPGGSGSQRRNDWRTWAWTENPYIHALAWVRGHFKLTSGGVIDGSKRLAGIGAPDDAIDIAAFCEGANVAHVNNWPIAGEWTTADDKWSVLAAMLQAGGGVPLNRGAQISCMVNTPRVSIYDYDREDLVGAANLKVMASRRDRINTIIPRYRSGDHKWEIVSAGPVTASTYVAEDGGEPRTREVEYAYACRAKQAAELAAYDITNARESLTGSLPSKPHLLGLRAGDAFTVTEAELGLDGQKFVVVRRTFDPSSATVTLEVRSETDGKHDFALGQAENPPPTPSLTAVDPIPAAPEAEAWTVTVRPADTGGTQQPGLVITGEVENERAAAVVFEHGPTDEGPWTQAYDGPATTELVEINGLEPAQSYYVAATYRSIRGVPSERTVWGPFTAPGLISAPDAAVYATLTRLQSDNWLTAGEKPEVIRYWQGIVAEYPGISANALTAGATTQRTALIAAYDALSTYLSGLSPAYDSVATDTVIVGATFRAKFLDYFTTKQAALDATVAANRLVATTAAANASTALNRLNSIAADNELAREEKPQVIREWAEIVAEYAGLSAQALSVGATSQRTTFIAAYDALSSYLSALTPAYNDLNQNTTVVAATFNARFTDYYTARQAVLNAMIGIVDADASQALATIAIIQSDGYLSANEKPELIRTWGRIVAEYPGLSAEALTRGATSQRTALIAAYNALSTYLSGLSPAYNDATQNTVIVPATFTAKFTDYYAAAEATRNAITSIVGTDATTALARLTIIQSDGYLSRDEKPEVMRHWARIVIEYPTLSADALAQGATTQRTTMIAAYTALSSYLSGLSPAYDDTSQDTVIVAATFSSKFTDYYAAAEAVRAAINGIIGGNATAALARLNNIASDNVLAREEKPQLVTDWAAIVGEKPGLSTEAANRGVTTELTTFNSAYTALSSYLSGLSPAYNDLTQDTVIVGTTFRSKFTDYFTARAALQNRINAIIGTDATTALGRLNNISSDNMLAREEKPQVVREYTAIYGEAFGIQARAVELGITTERVTFENAFNALVTYVTGLSPAYTDLTQDTVIVGTTFRAKFSDYYVAKSALQNAMAGGGGGGGGGNGDFQGFGEFDGSISGSSWQTVKTFSVLGVVAGSQMQVQVSCIGSTTDGGVTYSGQARLIQTANNAVVAGPEAFSIYNLSTGPNEDITMLGETVLSGTVEYALQIGGAAGTVDDLNGQCTVTIIPTI